MATTSIVPQESSNATQFDCGICDVIHECHCPRMRYACPVCVPPISVTAQNILAHEISLPESEYQPVTGLTMTGVVAATAYRRRRALKAVS